MEVGEEDGGGLVDHVDGGRGLRGRWGGGGGRSREGGGGGEKEGGNNVITSAAAPAPPGFSALPMRIYSGTNGWR